jgi:hypothetical protein
MNNMQKYIDCDVDGEQLSISYIDNKKKNVPVMLFVHGNSSSKESFNSQVNFFSENFRVIAPDLPGHGDSNRVLKNNYSLKLMSDFLENFVKTLDIKVYCLLGHSLGGHLCLQALNNISPQKFITWGAPPMTNPPIMEKLFVGNLVANYFFQEDLTIENKKDLFKECFEKKSSVNLKRFIEGFDKSDPLFRSQLISELSSLDFKDEFEELEKYSGETLFLLGSNEKIINNSYITENCFEYAVRLISKTSHNAHIDSVEDFNLEVLKCLKLEGLLVYQESERHI